METASASQPSVFTLIRSLTGDTKTFVRQEVQLAKTEISEKIAKLGSNAASLAIGGFVAYAGLIVILLAFGFLLIFAFEAAGLSELMAGFLGFLVIGLLVIGIGGALIKKAIGQFKKESLMPERTIHTLQELRGTETVTLAKSQSEDGEHQPSSEELQIRVEQTEDRLGDTLDELGRRLSPSHVNAQVKRKIQAQPYKYGLIAIAAGFFSATLLRWKMSRA